MSEELIQPSTQPIHPKSKFSFDLRIVLVLLLLVIAVMLWLWKPWQEEVGANTRTITVTGEATITATPDEYIFNPSYQFKNSDKAAALKELTSKSTEIVNKLKELGVADNKIKTNSGGSDFAYYPENSSTPIYTLTITVTLDKKELTQKIQDYLITTSPLGTVSPLAGFSESKQKELESQARDKATTEARSKADQSAKNLGFKIGKVKSVEDGAGFGISYLEKTAIARDSISEQSLAVQPGEEPITYSVTVTYFVK